MLLRALFLSTSLLLGACATAPTPSQPSASNFEADSRRAMEAYKSTGMVVGVMVDGKVVYTDAFGIAEEGTDIPVTEDMLFPIASISKAFTTSALAILVDRGELDWDDPIRKYIPEFAMSEPWISENFTIRDALTHRSGLPLGAGDLLFWPDGEPTADEIIAAMPHLKPSTSFRSSYAYDNLLYVIAGEVVERVSGRSWADFVTAELLEPNGMSNCAADQTRIRDSQSVVTGHERAAGAEKGTPIDPRTAFAPSIAAAAGIYCPVDDMMVWGKFWLDGAVTADGKRLISEKQVEEMWTGVTPKSTSGTLKRAGLTHQTVYGLGWNVMDFEGYKAVQHSGGAPGVISNFIIIPERDIVVFASGNDYRAAPAILAYHIADGLIDGQDADIIGDAGMRFADSEEKARKAVADVVGTKEGAASPSLPLSAYTGVYTDPWYGDVTISLRDGGLFIDMSRSEILDGPLTAYDGDVFAAIWPDRSLKADAFVTFEVENGRVIGMTMKAISDITDFSFDFHDLNLVKH